MSGIKQSTWDMVAGWYEVTKQKVKKKKHCESDIRHVDINGHKCLPCSNLPLHQRIEVVQWEE